MPRFEQQGSSQDYEHFSVDEAMLRTSLSHLFSDRFLNTSITGNKDFSSVDVKLTGTVIEPGETDGGNISVTWATDGPFSYIDIVSSGSYYTVTPEVIFHHKEARFADKEDIEDLNDWLRDTQWHSTPQEDALKDSDKRPKMLGAFTCLLAKVLYLYNNSVARL
jgi:hypothetical protein